MDNKTITQILLEIQNEQHPIEDEKTIIGYIKDAEFDINEYAGFRIDYEKDLKARKLLKNYVLYDRYKRLAEFKCVYAGEYNDLQAKYYNNSDLQ